MPPSSLAPLGAVALAVALSAPISSSAPDPIRLTARAFQPGELVLLTAAVARDAHAVTATVFEREVAAYRIEDGRWRAVFGIDLDQEPGRYAVTVESQTDEGAASATQTFVVHPKRFPTRRLRVAPKFVEPPPDVVDRIASEAELIQGIYEHSDPVRHWRPPFVRPVPDRANSRFGSRSVFNGEPRSPHSGTDFLSPAGRPVKAPNAGRVVAARDLYFTGRTVMIDHGLGLVSVLAHLSSMRVHEGDLVSAGDIVGRVGATGRVTGPHLHWSLRVGGARVDPLGALAILDEAE